MLARARAWLADDPDPATRAELSALLDARDADAIAGRFASALTFGTAGIRGPLGVGPARMNRVVVMRTSAGLASYLSAHGARTVVIGRDARHGSRRFARDAATVLRGAGLDVRALPRPLPTPVLAFAVRHLGADAGVTITASHNPPGDNGYKVYIGDGAQIAPPVDIQIAERIETVDRVSDLPCRDDWTTLGEEVVDAYLARAAALVPPGPRDLRIVYTPLHGVGREIVTAALARAGFPGPYVVPAQAEPDPDFPTVPFPNPEEPGAMDLALRAAAERDADIVLANDPDADRCAVGVPTAAGWRMLRGDEVGALLGAHLLRTDPSPRGTYATTIVSSSLLGSMARGAEVPYAETLTGFKWLARVPGLRYAYEEALGYCVDPDAVADKDGVTALLRVAELTAAAKAEGRTPLDLLDDIHREYGVHLTDQLALRLGDAAIDRLRAHPPPAVGGRAVAGVDDLAAGVAGLPPTDGVRLWLADGVRVVVRPSGTEPKLKCYLEVTRPPGATQVPAVRAAARCDLEAVRADLATLLQPDLQ
ncbi:MAG: phospho-sugar mutase [Streptosporangiaceae bacterium]